MGTGATIPEDIPLTPGQLDKLIRWKEKSVRTTYGWEVSMFYMRTTGKDPAWTRRKHPRWDGGVDERTGLVCKAPVWPKLLEFAVGHEVDAVDLIKAVFNKWAGGKPPEPDQIMTDYGLTLLRDGRAAREVEIHWEVQAAANLARIELCAAQHDNPNGGIRDILTQVLLDPAHRFPPCSASRWLRPRAATTCSPTSGSMRSGSIWVREMPTHGSTASTGCRRRSSVMPLNSARPCWRARPAARLLGPDPPRPPARPPARDSGLVNALGGCDYPLLFTALARQ